jgi:hypothetical protein
MLRTIGSADIGLPKFDPPGAGAATLKARTLTNLYNQRPTWLAHLHDALTAPSGRRTAGMTRTRPSSRRT